MEAAALARVQGARYRPTADSASSQSLAARGALVGAVLLYALVWNLGYQYAESPIHEDTGALYRPPAAPFVIAGYLLAALPALWMPLRIRYPSQVGYWWLYVVVVVPSMFLPFHVLFRPAEEVLLLPVAVVVAFALLGGMYFFEPPPLRGFGLDATIFSTFLAIGITLAVLVLGLFHGFDLAGAVQDIYARRLEARETLLAGSALAYVHAFLNRALVPFAVAYGLVGRRPLLVASGMVGAIASFAITAEKQILLLPLLMILLAVFLVRLNRVFGVVLVAVCATMLVTSALEFVMLGGTTVSSFLGRRVFVVPGHHMAYYWEYFSLNAFVSPVPGLLDALLGFERDLSASQSIGRAYYGSAVVNANANIWASAYANAGYFGMLIATLLAGVLFRFLDGLSVGRFLVGSLVAVAIATVWAEGALQTSFLSHGVWLQLVLLAAVPITADRVAKGSQ